MEASAQIFNEDCIAGMAERIAPQSVHLTVTSIPFEELSRRPLPDEVGATDLFTYSGKLEDVGNNGSTVDILQGRFAVNMRFVAEQLFRVHAAGTNVCIHIQQLLAYKNQHGFAGRRDFRGAMIDLFRATGFHFTGEVAIPKDPQQMAQRLNLHSLQFATGHSRNATAWAPAPNDYVLIFQKPGDIAVPVLPMIYKAGSAPIDFDTWSGKTGPGKKRTKSRTEYLAYIREWGRTHEAKNPGGWLAPDDWIKWARGTWEDIEQMDVLDGWKSAREDDEEKHVCLARGSLVLTRDGHKPIEEIEVGDFVLTHRGRWMPVVATACNGVKPVVRLTAHGVADLRLTPDHRVWARSCAGRGGKGHKPGAMGAGSHRRNAETATPEWMEAHRTKGSYVNLPLPPVEHSAAMDLSPSDWWIIGRWLGDGYFDSRGRAHIACAHDEVAELVTSMGKRAGHVAKRRTATSISLKDRLGQRSGAVMTVLRRCGRGAEGKKLPAEAMMLDAVRSESLLAGYLSADGHYVEKYDRWTASSVSRPLLLGMAMVAQRARGVAASVYAGRPPGECIIEGRTVKTKQDWILSIPPRNLSGFMLEDGAWKKVREVEPAGEVEVWDIQVAGDQSFVAEGCVVHNCPLQLSLIYRLVSMYTNPIHIQPDATVLDPFMGIGSTMYVCLGGETFDGELPEHRNVIGFELKESYFDQALRNRDKVSELVKRRDKNERPFLAACEA